VLVLQLSQSGGQRLVADPEEGAQLRLRDRRVMLSQGLKDLLIEVAVLWLRRRGVELQMGGIFVEGEGDGLGGSSGAVLASEAELVVEAVQVEAGVGPCVDVPGAPQVLPGGGAVGFASVVDEQHGQ